MFRRTFYLGLLALALSALAGGQKSAPKTVSQPVLPTADFVFRPGYPFRFIAYGDIRFTDPNDTVWSNAQYRDALVGQIAKEKPSLLLVIGDLVHKGSVTEDWDVLKRETAPWRRAGIPVLPVIGNHETWGDPQASNYFRYFPELKNRHWYTARAGNCYFILLDSELDAPASEQWKWLERRLTRLPSGVHYLFVVLHYPPYTRSAGSIPGGGHSARPEEEGLAKMLEDRQKALGIPIIVLSGHVHNYERYVHDGVTYIVSGGGGATPYTVPRQPSDFYKQPGPTYHFCRFTVGRNSLKAEMVKVVLVAGKPQFSAGDSFRLNGRSQTAPRAAVP